MEPMRILLLGGTVFLGRAFTDAALAAGHRVTHFHRGQSFPPDPRVETIVGDRTAVPLPVPRRAGEWDAVVDTSGFLPQVVGRSVQALSARAGRYLFVSSISVYRDFSVPSIDETAPVEPPPDPLPETLVMEQYGALKAACEAVVREACGAAATIVRPGLIAGPWDKTDRFSWWPARIARGGRVAAPGRSARPVQFIDVRDLALWMVKLIENDAGGDYNATSPPGAITMGGVLEACNDVAGSGAPLEWIDEDFLAARGIAPWTEMPLWIPEGDASKRGFMGARVDRALATGLAIRPLRETVRDTLEWVRTARGDRPWNAGLSPEREAELLAAWDARQSPIAR
jgi:2'-hydroxyisoflavone reductase